MFSGHQPLRPSWVPCNLHPAPQVCYSRNRDSESMNDKNGIYAENEHILHLNRERERTERKYRATSSVSAVSVGVQYDGRAGGTFKSRFVVASSCCLRVRCLVVCAFLFVVCECELCAARFTVFFFFLKKTHTLRKQQTHTAAQR